MQSLLCLCNIVKFEALSRSIVTYVANQCGMDKEREKKGGNSIRRQSCRSNYLLPYSETRGQT